MGADQIQRDVRLNIEEIVREVLARLNAEGAKQNKPDAKHDGGKGPSGDGRLTLAERLITVATLTGRLAGVKQCVAPPQAVVTPAAKDLLRERGVKLTFRGADAGERPARNADGARRLMLAVADAKFDPAQLAASLGREGIKIETTAATGLLGAIEAVSAVVSAAMIEKTPHEKAKMAIVFTRETPAAVCLANRVVGVRAAAAASTRDAKDAVRSVGANVLMIDPAERSFWELMQIAKAFAAGPRPCPLPWKERLS
jgi:ribose 5-phosphate isomerase RpiB